jgi:hypothetical protein
MADVLEGMGRTFNIPDLETLGHASRYVEGKRLKPPYDTEVRDRFYPSSYWTTTITWRDLRLVVLTDPVDATRFIDEMTGMSEPKVDVSIDHTYRVAEHWNREGNGMRQPARAAFYNDTQQTQLVASRNNSTDGALARALGLRYQPTVGTDFRGPDDNP